MKLHIYVKQYEKRYIIYKRENILKNVQVELKTLSQTFIFAFFLL
jgi:hypothetical protein